MLHLIDVQGYQKNDVFRESFTAGFKLTSGIAKEMETVGLYSYDAEINEQMGSSNRCVCF